MAMFTWTELPSDADVETAVNEIGSLLHESAEIIANNRERSLHAKQSSPLLFKQLERLIKETPRNIQNELSRGLRKFGQTFRKGDAIAIHSLQRIYSRVQTDVLETLRHAYDLDIYVSSLIVATENGRNGTTQALVELQQRLQDNQSWSAPQLSHNLGLLGVINRADSDYDLRVSEPEMSSMKTHKGLCIGASKLQDGDGKAMVTETDYPQSARSMMKVEVLRCSHCEFEGRVTPSLIWERIWNFQKFRIRVRWPFLAKSHLRQSIPDRSGRAISGNFSCLFCIHQGQESPPLRGVSEYMQHVASSHADADLSDSVLSKTRCVNDRECMDSEYFDINLIPTAIFPSNEDSTQEQAASGHDGVIATTSASVASGTILNPSIDPVSVSENTERDALNASRKVKRIFEKDPATIDKTGSKHYAVEIPAPKHCDTDIRGSYRYDLNMSAVWAVEKLSEQTLSLMNVLALLDPDGINEGILMPGVDTLTDPTYPVRIGDYEDAKAELLVSSLIINKTDDDADEDSIGMHRTVQDAVRAQMSPAQFHDAFQTAVELLLMKWPDKGRMWHYPVDRWPYCEKVSSHLIKIHAHYLSNCAANDCSGPASAFAELLIHGGWYWYQRGAPDQAKRLFDTSEHLSHRLPDGASLLESIWLCQGYIATETNDRSSSLLFYGKLKDSVMARIPEPRIAEDYENLATVRNGLGVSYMIDDRISEAKVEFEAARSYSSVRLRNSEMVFSIFMFATANLGLAHWLEGDFEQASTILTAAHDEYTRRRIKGEKQSFVPGRLMHALGNVKVSEGNLIEGLRWHQKALKHYHQTVGVGHHRTADMTHKVAEDLITLGRYAEARDFISQALLVFGSKKCYAPEQTRTTYLLGVLCEAEGEAHSHFDEALDIYKSIKRERGEHMPSGKLQAEHYNALVTFWSR